MKTSDIYKKWYDFPDCRIRLDLHKDGGENLWGKGSAWRAVRH